MSSDSLPRRVLFVDDERSQRSAFERIVGKAGYDVRCAGSVDEALALTERAEFPVVVADLRLPRGDGMNLVRAIGEKDQSTCFVLSTGTGALDLPSEFDVDRAITSIVSKPWDRDELLQAISRAHALAATRSNYEFDELADGILLIEDNPFDADLARHFLSEVVPASVDITTVGRLDDALDCLSAQEFGFVFTDLSLPDARGFDSVTRVARARPATPIVVFTGLDDEQLARHSLQLGAQDFLVKGEFNLETLRRAIHYAIDRKHAERRLVHMARHDPLTGLSNRISFRERVNHAIARSRRRQESFAVLLLDLDHFKEVNDRLGHGVGDGLLQELSIRLRSCAREVDMVARLGGDEFAILADGPIDREGLTIFGQRLLESFCWPVRVDQHEIAVSASIGAACFPEDGTTLEELLQCADSFMYEVKQAGRNAFSDRSGAVRKECGLARASQND